MTVVLSREIYVLFFEETEKDLRVIDAHVKNGDLGDVSLLAHRIRGRARVMDFAEFEELCTDVETLASDGEQVGIASKVEAVKSALVARRKTELG